MNFSNELKKRISDHIATAQANLTAYPMDEQQEMLQALEARIYRALETKADGQQPDIQMLQAILSEMEPAETYGPASSLISHRKNTLRSPSRRILFFCAIAILFLLFIAVWLADPFSSKWMNEQPPVENTPPTQAIP
jgi:hypothetical protein